LRSRRLWTRAIFIGLVFLILSSHYRKGSNSGLNREDRHGLHKRIIRMTLLPGDNGNRSIQSIFIYASRASVSSGDHRISFLKFTDGSTPSHSFRRLRVFDSNHRASLRSATENLSASR
jgi:hypothetical protein